MVCMVHARTGWDGISGRLSLEESRLLFRPRYAGMGAETVIALADVKQVRHLRGKPVLVLRLRSGDLPRRVTFHFMQPVTRTARSRTRWFRLSSWRRDELKQLPIGGKQLEEVDRWVELIRRAVAASNRPLALEARSLDRESAPQRSRPSQQRRS
jgi:hypothetical protein